MKRKLPVIFMLVCSIIYGQNTEPTKQETEQWIISVVQTYGGKVEFKDGKIICNNVFDPVFKHTRFEARLQDLGGVMASDFTEEIRAIRLACFQSDCVEMSTKFDNFNKKSKQQRVIIQLADIPAEMEAKLIKAFNHIIKLYGGKVIDDKF